MTFITKAYCLFLIKDLEVHSHFFHLGISLNFSNLTLISMFLFFFRSLPYKAAYQILDFVDSGVEADC